MSNWMVAVDDGEISSSAFNYVLEYMNKKDDHLYILNVMGEPTQVYMGYATAGLIQSLTDVEERKARKILVHYGQRSKKAGIKYTMMKGTENSAGVLICKAVKNYNIDTVVLGRRGLGAVERFFSGSASKYVVENAECNVVIVKNKVGPEEEHANLSTIIQAEEEERILREEEDAALAEEHADKEELLKQEEQERAERIAEEKEFSANRLEKMFSVYRFKEELQQKVASSV